MPEPYRLPYTLEIDIEGESFIRHEGVAEGGRVLGHFGFSADEVEVRAQPFREMAPLRGPARLRADFDFGRSETTIELREDGRSRPTLSFEFW